MDTNNGNFEIIGTEKFEQQLKKEKPQVFKVGEIIEIRGSRFRVEKIMRKKLMLKLLPQS